MSQSLVQYFQTSGNIFFTSCAIVSPEEDGKPVCLMSCFFFFFFFLFSDFGEIAVESLSHRLGRDFTGSSSR